MKIIQVLKDRIKNFESQQQKLGNERDSMFEELAMICAKINEYQLDINDMQVAIEKLEKPE